MIETIRQGLQADGITVSIAKLCRWFGVPRRTVYYKPVKSASKVDAKFVGWAFSPRPDADLVVKTSISSQNRQNSANDP